MSDAMTGTELAADAARVLIVAPAAAQERHRAAVMANGARVLGAVPPDAIDAALASLIAAEMIVIDGPGVDAERMAASAGRIADWTRNGDCRIVALLDTDALDLAAPVLMDAGAVLLCSPSMSDYAAALARASAPPGARLHDATQEREAERLRLLNEEVARLAAVLSDFAADPVRRELREPDRSYRPEPGGAPDPAPRTVRATIRARRLRDQHFTPNSSPIPPGTCCSTSMPRGWREVGCRCRACASRRRCRRRRRCAGSGRCTTPGCSSAKIGRAHV